MRHILNIVLIYWVNIGWNDINATHCGSPQCALIFVGLPKPMTLVFQVALFFYGVKIATCLNNMVLKPYMFTTENIKIKYQVKKQ